MTLDDMNKVTCGPFDCLKGSNRVSTKWRVWAIYLLSKQTILLLSASTWLILFGVISIVWLSMLLMITVSRILGLMVYNLYCKSIRLRLVLVVVFLLSYY